MKLKWNGIELNKMRIQIRIENKMKINWTKIRWMEIK